MLTYRLPRPDEILPPEPHDRVFLDLAMSMAALFSSNPGTKVGAVATCPRAQSVIATGVNRLPYGMSPDLGHPEWFQKPAVYDIVQHAEQNLVGNAHRAGTSLYNCRVYLPWFPCAPCAAALIGAGVTHITCTEPDYSYEAPAGSVDWRPSWEAAETLLQGRRATVHFVHYKGAKP